MLQKTLYAIGLVFVGGMYLLLNTKKKRIKFITREALLELRRKVDPVQVELIDIYLNPPVPAALCKWYQPHSYTGWESVAHKGGWVVSATARIRICLKCGNVHAEEHHEVTDDSF